ncbi:MAG: 16S rRNA (cytosine(1402)-N(4))-methyltransferase RsmH [Bryobacteraceae bacterium]|nr:16S rRNA (cytosine(1402)-N(4))-methyltransferase RsmH [Bryobacteraceae bacterium]
MHFPVLLAEVIEHLGVRPDGRYLDATTGLGGHAEAIAERLTTGRLIACDRDAESLELAAARLAPWKERIVFRQASFSQLESVTAEFGMVNGLVADLGASYWQLTHSERGFSLFADAPLDMRYDRRQELTAADLVNQLQERELADLFYRLAGERGGRRLSRAIVGARPIRTTGQLARLIESAAPRTKSRLHPATRVFMALRMQVNQEMEELDALLGALPRLVENGGRVVMLTFHSTEDRAVKRAFQELAREGKAKILTKHVVKPGLEESRANAPSRSAKLRAIQMNSGSKQQ